MKKVTFHTYRTNSNSDSITNNFRSNNIISYWREWNNKSSKSSKKFAGAVEEKEVLNTSVAHHIGKVRILKLMK